MRCAVEGCGESVTVLVRGGVVLLIVCSSHAVHYVTLLDGHVTTRALRRAPQRRRRGA